jgi:hypothetical protein
MKAERFGVAAGAEAGRALAALEGAGETDVIPSQAGAGLITLRTSLCEWNLANVPVGSVGG